MNETLSFSVLTANIISLLLLATLYFSNKQRMDDSKDMRYVIAMMGITALSNVSDMLVYYVNGDAGPFQTAVMYLSGSWLYIGNVLIGCTWAKFLTSHLEIPTSSIREGVYRGGVIAAVVLLVVNLLCPLVFFSDGGTYTRGPAYVIFLLFAIAYIVDSLVLYAGCRRRVGSLRLFPVQVFLVPLLIGVCVQAAVPEIAITWTTVAVAIAGLMTALKNELIFLDKLTGLYNRVYLEVLQKEALERKKNSWISGIMIDLNGFKRINDDYGHSEGDAALVLVAQLLRKSFSEYGVVTRYAGDEFVVILNTTDEVLVKNLIARSKKIFEDENLSNGKPYELSASMGYAIIDLKTKSIDAFMNRIDQEMYRDKIAYYQVHDRRRS